MTTLFAAYALRSTARERYYIVKDEIGRPWSNNSLIIRERFTYIAGPGSLPAPTGAWYVQTAAPTPVAQKLTNNDEMRDTYGLGLYSGEVEYSQYYYAYGFTPPSWFHLPAQFALPGVPVQGLVIPLWINDLYNSCENYGSLLSTIPAQTVRLNPNFIGIDGDEGPPPQPTKCAAPLLPE